MFAKVEGSHGSLIVYGRGSAVFSHLGIWIDGQLETPDPRKPRTDLLVRTCSVHFLPAHQPRFEKRNVVGEPLNPPQFLFKPQTPPFPDELPVRTRNSRGSDGNRTTLCSDGNRHWDYSDGIRHYRFGGNRHWGFVFGAVWAISFGLGFARFGRKGFGLFKGLDAAPFVAWFSGLRAARVKRYPEQIGLTVTRIS
jgi:hypothetical protein